MLFNSIEFLIFFPIVCLGYFLIPHRFRWIWLLVASYIFYMGWNAAYALLLLFSTTVTWVTSLLVDKSTSSGKRKAFLAAGIIINLSILFVFKYFGFFMDTLYSIWNALGIEYTKLEFSLILPVGISFYTFQAIGYCIDVYRKQTPVQRNFGKYALFVSFFPQLVAGPIERSYTLIPQFEEKHNFSAERAASGLRLMIWGFFKKIVIADTVCVAVNRVYNNVESFQGLALIFATFLFTIQIFCDFSGYSDIARGCARIMGFRLMKNFDHPYFATSIQDFRRRWHISLSTWFKDYVYIPLGGNRKGKHRTSLNLLITFLVSGLWHGANWTFIVWGGFHAVVQIIERYTRKFFAKLSHITRLEKLPRLRTGGKMLFTFCLVCFGWIFFRANSMQDAFYVIGNLFNFQDVSSSGIYTMFKLMFDTRAEVYRLLLTLPVFILASFIDRFWSINRIVTKQNSVIRFVIYVLILTYILLAARAEIQDFIYFQF